MPRAPQAASFADVTPCECPEGDAVYTPTQTVCEDSSDQVCVAVKERLAVCSEQFKKGHICDRQKKEKMTTKPTTNETGGATN